MQSLTLYLLLIDCHSFSVKTKFEPVPICSSGAVGKLLTSGVIHFMPFNRGIIISHKRSTVLYFIV